MAVKFGPGTFTIGETGTEVDCSCLVNSLTITHNKDAADATTKLCGDVVPGKITYTFAVEGNLDIDPDAGAAGLFALSQTAKGTQQKYTYTPNTEDGTTATGVLILDPLDFGSDEYGNDMTSDFSFDMVGDPAYTYGADAVEGLGADVESSSRAGDLVGADA